MEPRPYKNSDVPSLLTIAVVCGSLTQIVSINDYGQYSTGSGEMQGDRDALRPRFLLRKKR